jgi:hypothetical protein
VYCGFERLPSSASAPSDPFAYRGGTEGARNFIGKVPIDVFNPKRDTIFRQQSLQIGIGFKSILRVGFRINYNYVRDALSN